MYFSLYDCWRYLNPDKMQEVPTPWQWVWRTLRHRLTCHFEDFLRTWPFLGPLVCAHLEWFAVSIPMRPQSYLWQLMVREQGVGANHAGHVYQVPLWTVLEMKCSWLNPSTNFMVSSWTSCDSLRNTELLKHRPTYLSYSCCCFLWSSFSCKLKWFFI